MKNTSLTKITQFDLNFYSNRSLITRGNDEKEFRMYILLNSSLIVRAL